MRVRRERNILYDGYYLVIDMDVGTIERDNYCCLDRAAIGLIYTQTIASSITQTLGLDMIGRFLSFLCSKY